MIFVEVNISSSEYPHYKLFELVDQLDRAPFGWFKVRDLDTGRETEAYSHSVRLVWRQPRPVDVNLTS